MTTAACDRITFADLVDYAAADLSETQTAALEAHLFSCADCAARAEEFEALARSIAVAFRSATIGGFVTDAVLNRLAREGVRMRSFALSPGAAVACAVWDDDEVMALRLSADFGDASEVTLSQRIGGTEVSRTTGEIAASRGELVFALPAAWVRQLPAAEVEVLLTARAGDQERPIASYTLVHEGSLHR